MLWKKVFHAEKGFYMENFLWKISFLFKNYLLWRRKYYLFQLHKNVDFLLDRDKKKSKLLSQTIKEVIKMAAGCLCNDKCVSSKLAG